MPDHRTPLRWRIVGAITIAASHAANTLGAHRHRPRHRARRNPWTIAAAGVAVAMALTATIGTIVTVIDAGAMPGPAAAHTSTDDAGPASRAPRWQQ